MTDCSVTNTPIILCDRLSQDDRVDFEKCKLVYFDLETTSRSTSCDICQIAAVHEDTEFSIYVMPSQAITSGASAVNKLKISEGIMMLNNVPVKAVSKEMAFEKFICYLQNISMGCGVILIAHNCFRFDAPILLKNVERIGLLEALQSVVVGFADTLPILHEHLPERKRNKLSFSQVQLACDYIGVEATENAHNAVQDVRVLSKLIIILGVGESMMKAKAKSLQRIVNTLNTKDEICQRQKGLQYLSKGVSKGMLTKIAVAGISFGMLQKTWQDNGVEGITLLLAEHVGNGPRVTKNKKIIEKLITELQLISNKENCTPV
ncbi:uncharacterized protein [Venturia canescens]|uniref:uncharacterized protein n=1 Tax=Venturia canescens TaxID=32260 RepID=UPI001C9BF5AF|nr:uncharacterized protein LOC122405764 [Venturia canescens]